MSKKQIVIDTETTGFHPYDGDELLQVSIIDTDGNVLFDEYFKPQHRTEWKEAEQVNGISPEMVADRPAISEKISEINAIIENADTIIGYNTQFDIGFLKANGAVVPNVEMVDVMEDFAKIYGEWNDKRQGYKWQKLTRAAEYYGYDWSEHGKAHNSLGDCFATLHVYKEINEVIKNQKSEYMLLGRLQMDCNYYLGAGNRNSKHLWAGTPEEQIEKMKELYSKLVVKPEWLSEKDISDYEKAMLPQEKVENEKEQSLKLSIKAEEIKQHITDIADNCRNACELCGKQTQNDIFLSEEQAVQAVKLGIPVGYVTKQEGHHGSSAGLHTFYMLSEQNYSSLSNDNSMDKGPVFHYTFNEEQKKEMLDIINTALEDPSFAKEIEKPKKNVSLGKNQAGRK
ncbi:LPD11 domain-containing protein [uncultured Ruminococcus sp.]|uniref:LPD11 domain-containing protein n=1 Tax=uncultured Ruminococcus sp. TaxID=165186 RepID=UPI0026301C63|nr:LPD11 domain-containing protein [uncultured Ruminococcus sp.]